MSARVTRVPSVSVILPTFNRLNYLRSTVESVLVQTLRDWELIIADDGSGQETRTYLESLQSDRRVRILWLPHSGNPSSVRNCAWRQARGEYLAFLDSDDEWLPTKLERQVASLRRSPFRRWSYTGYIIIDARGEPRPGPAALPQFQGAVLERLLRHEVSIWTPAVVAERRLVEEAGGFDEQLLVFEDYDLWLRLACRSDLDLLDEPLTRVRRAHDQHHSEGSHGASMLAGWHHSLGKLRREPMPPGARALVDRLYAQSGLSLASRLADTDRLAAALQLARASAGSWDCPGWWAELPRLLLKLAAPRGLLGYYRRSRARSDSVSISSSR
ncbi:MAG TPA: glycosyltransferase [Steroidobacteraceae bacterium]|nr:glycosyltransferase [Steroidobacteraceae bacterium]